MAESGSAFRDAATEYAWAWEPRRLTSHARPPTQDRPRTEQRVFLSRIASTIIGGGRDSPDNSEGLSATHGSFRKRGTGSASSLMATTAPVGDGPTPTAARSPARKRKSLARKATIAGVSEGGSNDSPENVAAVLAAAQKEVLSPEAMKERFKMVDDMIAELTRGSKGDGLPKKTEDDDREEKRREKEEEARRKLQELMAERAEGRNPHRSVAQKIESRREVKTSLRGVPMQRISVAGPVGPEQVTVVDVGMVRSRCRQGTSIKQLLDMQRLEDARKATERRRQGKSLAAKALGDPASPSGTAPTAPLEA